MVTESCKQPLHRSWAAFRCIQAERVVRDGITCFGQTSSMEMVAQETRRKREDPSLGYTLQFAHARAKPQRGKSLTWPHRRK